MERPGSLTDQVAFRLADPLDERSVRVCVVIPSRNDALHLEATLDAVLGQTFPGARTEIVVVDGMSSDGSRDLLARYASAYPNLRILDNPSGKTPCALNIGIAATSAEVIVRVDSRCVIAPDYVERCVSLLATSGAANVGGLMRPHAYGRVGRAIALSLRSRFGVGNGRFHYLERQEYVDTVYLGAFRRTVLREVGGFDEELIRNQDDELNHRIRQAGYGILLSPDIVSRYAPRTTLHELWRQYFQYGFWKVRVIRKHPQSTQPKHLAPPALIAGLLASFLSFGLFHELWLLTPVLTYVCAILVAAVVAGRRRPGLAPLLTAVFPCLHLAYGSGFLLGFLTWLSHRLRSKL